MSFLLINENEELTVESKEEFAEKLGITDENERLKVICCVGNTGAGKSHLLNSIFFDGNPIFETSPLQTSCTIGVWAAYDAKRHIIVIDTEGMLGVTANAAVRERLLLKVLGASDVVVYCLKEERIPTSMKDFLQNAGRAYSEFFASALEEIARRHELARSAARLGPSVVIFQQTIDTNPLKTEEADEFMRDRLGEDVHRAFCGIHYVGVKRNVTETNWQPLRDKIDSLLANCLVRSYRPLASIFLPLLHLNQRFAGSLSSIEQNRFPLEYFACQDRCLACNVQCSRTIGHVQVDGSPHTCRRIDGSEVGCRLCLPLNNVEIVCRRCHESQRRTIVGPRQMESDVYSLGVVPIAKRLWNGEIWDCPVCGVIYQPSSWFGKGDLEKHIRRELVHVWVMPEAPVGSQHVAWRTIETIGGLASSISSAAEGPQQVLKQIIAPHYFYARTEAHDCFCCKEPFDRPSAKHNCRACGRVVCNKCSKQRQPVPQRDWLSPVRICDVCVKRREEGTEDLNDSSSNNNNNNNGNNEAMSDGGAEDNNSEDLVDAELVVSEMNGEHDRMAHVHQTSPGGEEGGGSAGGGGGEGGSSSKLHQTISTVGGAARAVKEKAVREYWPWKVGQAVSTVAAAVSTVSSYSGSIVADWSAPDYWDKNDSIIECFHCKLVFTEEEKKHHCRACGHGFCGNCSNEKRTVPARGWAYPVRVCIDCAKTLPPPPSSSPAATAGEEKKPKPAQ